MSEKNLRAIQLEADFWLTANFPNTDHMEQYIGIAEEVGELGHAVLKNKQRIRNINDEEYERLATDAVGDILIYLMNFCNVHGWDLQYILNNTWEQVQRRDWRKKDDAK